MTHKSNKYERLWISPDYKRMLKAEAALKGMSIFDYTQEEALRKGFVNSLNMKDEKKAFNFKL